MLAEEPGLPSGGRRGLVPGGPRFQVAIVTWSVFTPNTVMGKRGSLAEHVRFFPLSALGLWPGQPLSSHLGIEPRPSPHPPADPGHSCRARPVVLLDRSC